MKRNIKKLFQYYGPYKGLLIADLLFAIVGASVTLVIPLIVRYITGTVIHYAPSELSATVIRLAGLMLGLVLVECGCNIFILQIDN